MICSGSPKRAKVFRSNAVVLLDVVVIIVKTSGQLECASVSTNRIFPFNGTSEVCEDIAMGLRAIPRGVRGLWGRISVFLTRLESFHTVFNDLIQPGPPHVAASERFHGHNSRV